MIHIGGCRVAKNKPLGGFKVQIDLLELELWRFEAQNDEICFSGLSRPRNLSFRKFFFTNSLIGPLAFRGDSDEPDSKCGSWVMAHWSLGIFWWFGEKFQLLNYLSEIGVRHMVRKLMVSWSLFNGRTSGQMVIEWSRVVFYAKQAPNIQSNTWTIKIVTFWSNMSGQWSGQLVIEWSEVV